MTTNSNSSFLVFASRVSIFLQYHIYTGSICLILHNVFLYHLFIYLRLLLDNIEIACYAFYLNERIMNKYVLPAFDKKINKCFLWTLNGNLR